MTSRGWRGVAAVAVACVATFLPATAGNADDMAGDWQVVGRAEDPCGKMNPIRYGYYSFADDRGWGWSKMYFKHGVTAMNVWRGTMTDSCGFADPVGSTTWIYRSKLVYEVYQNGRWEEIDSTITRAVNQRAQFNGERKGLITLYCEGHIGYCPAWVNQVIGGSRVQTRGGGLTVGKANQEASRVTSQPAPALDPAPESVAMPAVVGTAKGSRATAVLARLTAQVRKLTYALTPTLVELRQADPNTVEIIYTYPGYDGLIGLRRDISVEAPNVDPNSRVYALAANENNPEEVATMLRVDLEAPPPVDQFKKDQAGIAWWGTTQKD
jgi:hypothetical protein